VRSLIVSLAILALALPAGAQAPPPAPSGTPPSGAPQSAGDALFARADFEAAAKAYADALAANASDVDAHGGLARIALYRNDVATAETQARAIAQLDPANRRAMGILKTVAERRGNGTDYLVDPIVSEVDVPFVHVDPLPVLVANVNGHPARLLLDTGGVGLDLSAPFAKSIGLETQTGGAGVFAGGRQAEVRVARVDVLQLGAATIRGLPVNVIDGLPPDLDGVLGTNVLYRFLSTIDYTGGRLVLRPKSDSEAFEKAAEARGDAIVPMLLVPDHFIFARARAGNAPEALFNIDTGGGGIGVQLTKASLDAAGIVPNADRPQAFGGGGGQTRVLPFVADVTLGTKTIRGTPGLYFPDGDQYGIFPFAVAGTISHEFFKHGALTFDFAAMKLVYRST